MNDAHPYVALDGLDHLWFQVAGTLCNLTCHHCFISCSPTNHSFEFLPIESVRAALAEAQRLGVKEFYFTGGEPFLHPRLVDILEETLAVGPASVLTNGTVLLPRWVDRLAEAEARSIYSLEFRVSIDGFSEETNDPIRGPGTFRRAMEGVQLLVDRGFMPIITVVQTWEPERNDEMFREFVRVMHSHGYARPRIKIIPTLRIGAEEERTSGYGADEAVTRDMMEDYDASQLVCSHSRIVTSKGVYVCPILIDDPEARMGETLSEALEAYPLRHGACSTCYAGGAICSNFSSGGADVS